MLPVILDQPLRHRFEAAGKEQVEEQHLNEIVGVVPERDLCGADLRGNVIQDTPSQARARRGIGVQDLVRHLADPGVLNPVLPATGLAGASDRLMLVVGVPPSRR